MKLCTITKQEVFSQGLVLIFRSVEYEFVAAILEKGLSKPAHPPPGHLSGICHFFARMLKMPHGGVSSYAQNPHGGALRRVQMPHGGVSSYAQNPHGKALRRVQMPHS